MPQNFKLFPPFSIENTIVLYKPALGLTKTAKQLVFATLKYQQFFKDKNNTRYWVITPYKDSTVRYIGYSGNAYGNVPTSSNGVRPSLNLKQNVVITGGDGTKNNPFQIELSN